MKSFAFLPAALALFLPTSHSTAAVAYAIVDLGTVGGTFSTAAGLNNAGQVVGDSLITGDSTDHAFRYSPGSGMLDLGIVGSTGVYSYALAINASGTVVGVSAETTSTPRAFLYDGTMHDLGTLGGTRSVAQAINDTGSVVGYAFLANDTTYHAFLRDTTVHDLGTLGGAKSQANAINASGLVVGDSQKMGSSNFHAFLFTPAAGGPPYVGSLSDLGTLGGSNSYANAINSSGAVAGTSDRMDGLTHAYRYTPGSGMLDLGTLGGVGSIGNALNSDGNVVGRSNTADGTLHAFIYASGAMVDLNTLIDPASGWELKTASTINDAGQIAGWGTSPDGHTHAYLLTPVSTLVPPVSLAAPVVAINGKKKVTATGARIPIKGVASGSVTSVSYRVGKGPFRNASGSGNWRFVARLQTGRNKISVVAHGPAGDSVPAVVVVLRR